MPITYPTLKFFNPDLLIDVQQSFTTVDQTVVGSSLTPDSIIGISDGDYLLLGEFGQEQAEIVRVSGSPSGSTVTLTVNTVFVHLRNTPIYRIDRNQVEFSRATTLTGSKSVLDTVSIAADQQYTVYVDTTNTTGFGFSRAKNSSDTTYSNYSESYPYAGYSNQSLKLIFDSCLRDLGLVDELGNPQFKGAVNRSTALQAACDAQDELALLRHRWSYLTDFGVILGEIETGQDTYAMPDNVAFENGYPAILNVWLGAKRELTFIDRTMMNDRRINAVKDSLGAAITSTGDVTVTLTDSSDFPDSGSIQVVDDDGEGFDSIDYTSNNRGTNVLSGVTNIAETHLNGAIVWYGVTPSEPNAWNAFEGNVVIDPVPSETYEEYNLKTDLYTKPTLVNDLADEAQFPAAVLKPYICSKLALLLDDGNTNRSLAFSQQYEARKQDLLGKETTGQYTKLKPLRRVNSTVNQRAWTTNRNND